MSRRDEEKREYRGDVTYEVWRRGGNVDRINDDRVTDSFYEGVDSSDAASRELRHQRPAPIQEEELPPEEFPPEEPALEEPEGTAP